MSIAEKILGNLADAIVLGPTFPLRHLSKLCGRQYHRSTIKQAGRVCIRPDASDAQAFIQVFRDKQYDLSASGQFTRVMAAYEHMRNIGHTPVIIDAGANVGAASIWFAKLFPAAHVLAIEPDAANAEICRLNTRNLSNVTVIQAAIGSEGGRVSLSNPLKQAWAVQSTRSDKGEVSVCTIPDLVRDMGNTAKIFIVKVDIEGFEADLFATNTDWVDEAEVIMIEPHDRLFPGRGTSITFQKVLAARNFEMLISGDNLLYIRLSS